MRDPGRAAAAALDRECAVFTRYLIGRAPDEYVRRKYREAHAVLSERLAEMASAGGLHWVATRHPVGTRMVDAYCRVLAPRTELRAKLVVLLAILETSRLGEGRFRSGHAMSTGRALGRMALEGTKFLLALIVALPIVGPAHLLTRSVRTRPAANGA